MGNNAYINHELHRMISGFFLYEYFLTFISHNLASYVHSYINYTYNVQIIY